MTSISTDNDETIEFEFHNLFDSFDYEIIRNRILNRQMTTCSFTTVLWRIFLHCLPRDSTQWNGVIHSSREIYDELVENYLIDLNKLRQFHVNADHLNHPLSQEENSLWHKYYIYEDLKDSIYQDVIRTFQHIDFFKEKSTHELLLHILYIHSRHYEQSVPYRQGMHEILAIIVYSIHLECINVNKNQQTNEIMKKIYDPKYLAHDSYMIYQKIMEHLRRYYDFKLENRTKYKIDSSTNRKVLFQQQHDLQIQMNDTVTQINSIFQRLKEYDLSLYETLVHLNIEPTFYGIRWLRLLFGREISFETIPILWTIIFCYDERFGFVEYVFLAILIEIGHMFKREETKDNCTFLQYFMRPEIVSDTESMIKSAVHFEKLAQRRKMRHLSTDKPSIYHRSISADQNKNLPMISSSDLIQSNATSPFLSQSKRRPSQITSYREMGTPPAQEIRERFDENIQIQQKCADYINRFIQRIKNSLNTRNLPNQDDDIFHQLAGLEYIAKILDGTSSYGIDSFKLQFDNQSVDQSSNNLTNDF